MSLCVPQNFEVSLGVSQFFRNVPGLTPRDTLDYTVSLVFSWCPSKLLSVPYVSFKYLMCPSSLGTLLISYCSSKDEDFHQCSPKYQSLDWSNTPHRPVSLGRCRCPSVRPELVTLVSVHGTSEDGSIPLGPPNFTTLLDLEEMKEPL